jgi:hypothetical protein
MDEQQGGIGIWEFESGRRWERLGGALERVIGLIREEQQLSDANACDLLI